jgi:hypothetical protein
MKMTAFWDIVPCSLVKVDRRFRCEYCLHSQSEAEGCHLNTHCRENLKPHNSKTLSVVVSSVAQATL